MWNLSATLWVVALSTGAPALAAVPIVQEGVVRLGVQAVCVQAGGTRTITLPDFEVTRGTPAVVESAIPWEGASSPGSLKITARVEAGIADEPRVQIEARFSIPGEPTVSASRPWTVRDSDSTLFPIYDASDGRIVLTLRSEVFTRPVVRALSSLGQPVRFHLEIERVLGERSVPLETNDLDTFVGEPVEYAFRRGADDTLEWLRLVLTAVRVTGDVTEVRAEVSGGLPGPTGPSMLHRTENLVSTRGATSSFAVLTGEPASGYRFRVTAQF